MAMKRRVRRRCAARDREREHRRSRAHATRETIAAQAFHFLSSSIGRNLRIATDPITSCEVNPAVAL